MIEFYDIDGESRPVIFNIETIDDIREVIEEMQSQASQSNSNAESSTEIEIILEKMLQLLP